MKIKTTKQALASAMGSVSGVAETKSAIPAYANVLIEAWPDGGVSVAATNGVTSIRAALACESVDDPGCVAVDAKRLASAVKSVAGVDVSMVVDGAQLVVRSGRTRFKLPAMPGEDFPAIADVQHGAEWSDVSADALRTTIGMVKHAVCVDDSRPNLCGVQIDVEGGSMMCRATDGYRYAGASADSGGRDLSALVPMRSIHALLSVACGDGTVAMIMEGSRMFARSAIVQMSTSLGEDFPTTARLIPSGGTVVPTPRGPFMDAIRRVQQMADDVKSVVCMGYAEGTVTLAAEDAVKGAADDVVDVPWAGDDLTVGAHGRYMTDALSVAHGDVVDIAIGGPLDPIKITSSGRCEFTAVVMPMRIGAGS